jgi:large subunit ribosomal protein L10
MTRTEKTAVIAELVEKFNQYDFFYITNTTTMTVAQVTKFRRVCFEKGIEFKVYKNTLIQKAFEGMGDASANYVEMNEALKGTSAIMFCETANLPAKTLKAFHETGTEKPLLKGAYIGSSVYLGNDQLDALTKLKSKEELLGEVIGLLLSPAQNLVGALKSGGSTIAGLVKALEEREAA